MRESTKGFRQQENHFVCFDHDGSHSSSQLLVVISNSKKNHTKTNIYQTSNLIKIMASAKVHVVHVTSAASANILHHDKNLLIHDDDEKDNDESSCSNCSGSSADTQDAFLNMLGLSNNNNTLADVLTCDEEIEEEENEVEQRNDVIIAPIDLPPRCSRHLLSNPVAITVKNLLSKEECNNLIEMATTCGTISTGFQYITEATHTANDGTTYKVPIQHPNPHQLSICYAPHVVEQLWNFIQPILLLEQQQNSSKSFQLLYKRYGMPIGLNPKLRVLKYNAKAKDHFEPHFDATTIVENLTSRLTVLLYLNSGNGIDFQGGETLYLNAHISNNNNQSISGAMSSISIKNTNNNTASSSTSTKVTPHVGSVVIFDHDLYHAGLSLDWGTKYVLRTDVLFANNNNNDSNGETIPEEMMKEQQNNDNKDDRHQSVTSTTSNNRKILLVSHICDELKWSTQHQSLLDDLGLLHVTLESFLVPGFTLLEQMLLEQGLQSNQIIDLIQHALTHVQQ